MVFARAAYEDLLVRHKGGLSIVKMTVDNFLMSGLRRRSTTSLTLVSVGSAASTNAICHCILVSVKSANWIRRSLMAIGIFGCHFGTPKRVKSALKSMRNGQTPNQRAPITSPKKNLICDAESWSIPHKWVSSCCCWWWLSDALNQNQRTRCRSKKRAWAWL